MAKEEKKAKEEEKKVSSVVYKVHMHCPKCSHDMKKLLLRTPGVQNVDVKFEKNEITVKGIIDEKKIHKRMEKLSKRKVEILPPPAAPKVKETTEKEKEKVVKETKVTVQTTTIKVFMHCNKCEHDLRMKLLKKDGIHNVQTDFKAQTIAIEGTVESKKLLSYMNSVHKHAEIVPPKEEKKDKEKVKEKVEVKTSTETTKIVEFKEETKVKANSLDDNVPYFVHYVYAPQLFSDENPNACSIM